MPTYEYECTSATCSHHWELDQRITAAPEKKCPKCSEETARRLISATHFVLAGQNWAAKSGY